MIPETTVRTLGAIAAVWPRFVSTPETMEAWEGTTPDVPVDVALEAVKRLATTDNFAPSIARFMTMVQLLERERAQPTLAARSDPAEASFAAERISLLKNFWSAARKARPDCDHHAGGRSGVDADCPRCSTSKAWVDSLNAEAMALMETEVPR